MLKILTLAFGAISVAVASTAPLAGWSGNWHLDRAASHFRGELTHIVRAPEGYRFILGPINFTLADDGAFHPTVAGRETRLARLGNGRWEREHRVNGHVVDHSILAVSPDGSTLTITGEHPGAPPERLIREGEGSGLAGTWRSTRLGINAAATLALTDLGAKRLRWGSRADGNWYVVTVDGPPAVNQGPTASPIATLQVEAAQDGTLRWTERLNGKSSRFGIERRSANGRLLTETVWYADTPAERQVLIYHRH